MAGNHYFKYDRNVDLSIRNNRIVTDIDGNNPITIVEVADIAGAKCYVFENSAIHYKIGDSNSPFRANVNKTITFLPDGKPYTLLNLSRTEYEKPLVDKFTSEELEISLEGKLGCGPAFPVGVTDRKTTEPKYNLIIIEFGGKKYIPLPIGLHNKFMPPGEELPINTYYYALDSTKIKSIEDALKQSGTFQNWVIGIDGLGEKGAYGLTIYEYSSSPSMTKIWPD